jgi:hypothetical protein
VLSFSYLGPNANLGDKTLKIMFINQKASGSSTFSGWRALPITFPFPKSLFLIGMVFLLSGWNPSIGLISEESDPLIIEISKALKEGNAKELSKHFNLTVEISLPGHEDVFSKTQAEQVVTDFFKKNKPSAYQIQHQSGPADARFVIGNLSTVNGNFRVYFLLKNQAGKATIHLLKFEKN